MTQFDLEGAIEILGRTPLIMKAWLSDLPAEWSEFKHDEDNWNAYDIIGHFIHGEKTDWIPRAQIILKEEGSKEFEPFDRFAQYEDSKGKTLENLLDDFARLREENIETLKGFGLKTEDWERQGIHPAFGVVNLKELIATWVVHDLDHITQIAAEMGLRYKDEVGPWGPYLGVLTD